MILFKALSLLRRGIVSRITGSALSLVVLGLGGLTADAASAAAQTKPAAGAAAPVQPGSTTAAFDDWVLTCQRAGPADKPLRVCEVGQIVRAQVPGQGQEQNPVARVAIGHINKTDPLHLTALLPPNASFPSTVRIGLSETDPNALDIAWHRCVAGFCQADIDVRDDLLKTWRAATDPLRITFKDAAGRSVVIPVSPKGLGPALDQLAKEPS